MGGGGELLVKWNNHSQTVNNCSQQMIVVIFASIYAVFCFVRRSQTLSFNDYNFNEVPVLNRRVIREHEEAIRSRGNDCVIFLLGVLAYFLLYDYAKNFLRLG